MNRDSDSSRAPAREDGAARRQQLAVLCALDRVSLRLVLRPAPPSPRPAGAGLGLQRMLLDAGSFLPGAFGRWSRRLAFGANILRAFR